MPVEGWRGGGREWLYIAREGHLDSLAIVHAFKGRRDLVDDCAKKEHYRLYGGGQSRSHSSSCRQKGGNELDEEVGTQNARFELKGRDGMLTVLPLSWTPLLSPAHAPAEECTEDIVRVASPTPAALDGLRHFQIGPGQCSAVTHGARNGREVLRSDFVFLALDTHLLTALVVELALLRVGQNLISLG